MSDKAKEKVETSPQKSEETPSKTSNWKTWAKGIAIGAGITAVTLLAYSKFAGDDEEETDFDDEITWTPMPEPANSNNQ